MNRRLWGVTGTAGLWLGPIGMPIPADSPEPSILWRRNPRARRVSLRVDPRSGHVVVTLPPRASKREGLRLLAGHADWVRERLERLPEATPFAAGGTVPINGAPCPIVHDAGGRGGAWLAPDGLHVSGGAEFLARRVADFLRREAGRRFAAAAAEAAARAGLKAGRIAIKDTRSRWGSCTGGGGLMFNWRLLMAPPFVQHYVVAHEVAHLRHMNHAPQFWALVHELTPHRTAASAWLKEHGPGLLRVG